MGMETVVLGGRCGRLEPLTLDHADALLTAATEDRTSHSYSWIPSDGDDVTRYVEKMVADQQAAPRCRLCSGASPQARDSAYLSVIASEWPGVRARLDGLMART